MSSIAKRDQPKFVRDGGSLPAEMIALYKRICDSDMSFEQVAARSGVTINTLSRWFNRGQDPSLSNYIAVANTINYDVKLQSLRKEQE
jgi:transcriptional regulator with XRE-family HTH domain